MTLAYTPELSDYHSGTLRRVAWALGKPMTKALHTVFDSLDLIVDPGKICEKCKDKTLCDQCYFKTRERMNTQLPIDPIKHDPVRISDLSACDAQAGMTGLTTEVEMKVNQVSVLVSKKIGKNFCSWSLSYGATAEVEDEHFTEAISQLDTQLRDLVSTALPTPNGNGNGHGTQPQLQG